MSNADIMDASGKLKLQYLPTLNVVGNAIVQSGGAIAGNLTGTVNIPATGNYYLQMYLWFNGAGAAIGTGAINVGITGSDSWPQFAHPAAALTTAGVNNHLSIGQLQAGTQTITFTPTTGMNLGASGELAIRVMQGVVTGPAY